MLEEKDNSISPRTFYPKDEKVLILFTKSKLQRARLDSLDYAVEFMPNY